jgi:uncharacterized protein
MISEAEPVTLVLERSPCQNPELLEQAGVFECQGETLVGVLSSPVDGECRTGLLVIVGGPQYRGGSHRHFVKLARELAHAGWPVFRFDARGMGDSTGPRQGFEQLSPDIGAAIAAFQKLQPTLERVVLWGLCDGASAALLYLDAHADTRVAGLVLLNPWVRSAQTLVKAQVNHYYARRLLDVQTWRALVRGRIRWRSLLDFGLALGRAARATLRPTPAEPLGFQARMAHAWARFGGPSLLVLSGSDITAREFVDHMNGDAMLAAAAGRNSVTTLHLAEADHTLSSTSSRAAHHQALVQWLRKLDTAAAAAVSRPAAGERS